MKNEIHIEELILKLRSKKIEIDYFFNRELVYIKTKDFEKFEKYFLKPKMILKKLNFRSKHSFKHIHCLKSKNISQFHIDHGNPDINLLFSISHFFIDVIPYFTYHLIKMKVPYEFKRK